MRTLSPTRAAPNRKRPTRRRPASDARASDQRPKGQRHRFESALPRFWLVPALPRTQSLEWLQFDWSRLRIRWDWLIALSVALSISYAAYWTQSADQFFVYQDRVTFENLGYLNSDELYQLSEIDSWNIFWLRSETIRQRLLTHAFITDAQVTIEWPAKVTIRVLPAEPVAIWLSGKGSFWVMRNGFTRTMEQNAIPALPQIVDHMLDARTVTAVEGSQIQQGILDATLTLVQRVPGLASVSYDNDLGINFALPATDYFVYWGDERNFDKKVLNLEAAKQLLASGQANGSVIDLRTAARPVIR